jgi:mannitol-1-phosphate/altronate dehydrogenase
MDRDRSAAVPRPLNNETLQSAATLAALPSYDRAKLTPGVVHIGVGGFHRAHQATYFDALAERGATDWGVIGVGLHSRSMKEALEPQDLLYTVVERDADADVARVVGTLDAYLYAPDDPEAVFAALADARIRLVTLTVTGAGYHVEPATYAFDPDAPDVRADVANPEQPTTFLGYVVEALDRRRRAGRAPFTVLSCDNVPCNGRVARAAVVSFARLRDAALADWIDAHVAFPSSMVDRITPETTADDAELVRREFGVGDRWPVVTERFRQWIVEDDFCNGRPPLEEVGVQFVADVGPYELMKKRLLNGSHCALGYLGSLAGHRTTDEAMADPILRVYVSALMRSEVAPALPEIPGIDLDRYIEMLLERFANPKIKDELSRLARRGSVKMPAYLLPSIGDARAAGRPHGLLTLAVAAWVRCLQGVDAIEISDPRRDQLQALARAGGLDPRPLLGERSVFGDLSDDAGFAHELEDALRRLDAAGPRAVIADRLPAPDAPLERAA